MKFTQFKTLCLSLLLVLLGMMMPLDLAIAHPLAHNAWFLAQAAGTPTPPASPPASAVPETAKGTPAKLQPTTDRKPVDRQPTPAKVNEKAPATSTSEAKPSPAGGPYDMKAIEEFYKSLYGS